MAKLFIDDDGKEYSSEDVKNRLKNIGSHDCDALFIHSDIMFGRLAKGVKRKDYLEELKNCFDELGIKNLIVPAFTYSFCNKEDYDVINSKTSMGVFNEYLRHREDSYRTLDPLLSLSVPSFMKDVFLNLSNHSLGKDSGLDRFHSLNKGGGFKILFFGASLAEHFTYLHYIEKMRDVPYWFDMGFSGKVTDYEGNIAEVTQFIHTKCWGVKLLDPNTPFENYLYSKNFLKKERLGNLYISCISEKDAYYEVNNMLSEDINYFLEEPFTEADLEKRYTFGLNGKRVTHC